MKTTGIYFYGIIPNIYNAEMHRLLENSGVYAIPFQNVLAIVSDRNTESIDYSDKEALGYMLIKHQKTIENLMAKGFNMLILMKLGTIVSSKDKVFNILTKGYDLIVDALMKIEHLTEIDIAVSWANFSHTINEVASHPEIVALRADIINKTEGISQSDQLKVGMLLQSKLKEKKTVVELNILNSLAPITLNIKTHEVMNDQMIINSAFLIKKNSQQKFEQLIDQLNDEFTDLLNFKLVGPLPCYSFYTLEVKELDAIQVEQAKIQLELGEETSESEIKKAYLKKAKLFHPDALIEINNEENFNKINKAYHTLLNYSAAAKQSSKNERISLSKENIIENLTVIKIKD